MQNKTLYSLIAACILIPACAIANTISPTNRIRLSMDQGWKFQIGKYVPYKGNLITSWNYRFVGDNPGTIDSITNSSKAIWKSLTTDTDGINNRKGFAWYKTQLPISHTKPHILYFTSINDNATIYLNGIELMRHTEAGEEFTVKLDEAWSDNSPNQLLILVQNTGNSGGIIGPVILGNGSRSVPPQATSKLNDSDWRTVQLPHDYVIEQSYDTRADKNHGYLPTPTAWYRKSFSIPANYAGKSLWIDFDGVYRDSQIWLNGEFLGRHPGGYTGFHYDISKIAKMGAENLLTVYIDPSHTEGWWYEGGGIYRHVWLNIADTLHIAPWGTSITSVVKDVTFEKPSAELNIKTIIKNDSDNSAGCRILSTILDPNGNPVASVQSDLAAPALIDSDINQVVKIANVQLWSVDTPVLYTLHSDIIKDGNIVDSHDTPFGIRTIRFDASNGFYLNEKPIKIKGTCNHQYFAGVGIAVPDSISYWQIKTLKEMGSNAYRSAHNPPSPELLDACDRLGMMMIDENRHLGDTYSPKTKEGTPADSLTDLDSMVLRDRNHPSIIAWSLCNEEPLQSTDKGALIFSEMRKRVRFYDDTRPIAAAIDTNWGSGISTMVDIFGGNYRPQNYDKFHEDHPTVPMFASESASAVGDRGIYADDYNNGHINAYDTQTAGDWANTAQEAWKAIAGKQYMAGCFIWTGFDYKGEPTPTTWPTINSHFGIIDTCGFPKDVYYYYKSWWSDKPVVHVLPHWNAPEKSIKDVKVWVYSNCDKVELFLNNAGLGMKEMPKYGHLEWIVPYAAGSLTAKGYNNGKYVLSDTVTTTGIPYAIRLKADRTELKSDSQDTVRIEASVIDKDGNTVPNSNYLLTFGITGPGTIIGVGNGDPSSHESDKANIRHAFNGLCMVLVKSGNAPGEIKITAESAGVKPGTLILTVKNP